MRGREKEEMEAVVKREIQKERGSFWRPKDKV